MVLMAVSFILLIGCPLFGQSQPGGDRTKTVYSLGPGIIWQKSIYRGVDDKIIPVPAFSVRSRRFSFNGIGASYQIYSSQKFKYSAGLSVKFSGFNPDDSDYLEGMRKKRFQLNLSNSGEYFLGQFFSGLKVSMDLNDFGRGWEGEVFSGRRFRFGKFMLSARIKAVYESPKMTNVNYGVYENEALLNRPYYKPSQALSSGGDISIIRAYEKSSLFLLFSLKKLDQTIVKSPIVDKSLDISFFSAYTFNF